jgi:hypothetical protein
LGTLPSTTLSETPSRTLTTGASLLISSNTDNSKMTLLQPMLNWSSSMCASMPSGRPGSWPRQDWRHAMPTSRSDTWRPLQWDISSSILVGVGG